MELIVEKSESIVYEVIDKNTNEMIERFEALSYPLNLSKRKARKKAYNLIKKLNNNERITKEDINSHNSGLIPKGEE